MPAAEGIRIQKALADAGVASRRAADELVRAGRVTVNGRTAVTGQRVDPAADSIAVDGRALAPRPPGVYLALWKPAGVTSTVADRHAERTVLDLVPPELRRHGVRLYPVGRLDRDSEGLLLITNDGDWAQHVLHPRHEVEREYAIGLAGPLAAAQVEALQAGIELDEGLARLSGLRRASVAETARLERAAPLAGVTGSRSGLAAAPRGPLTWYRAVLTQGWRRQLRRMFAAAGAPVERLVRVRIGGLRLEDLGRGEVRALSAAQRERVVSMAAVDGREGPGSGEGTGRGGAGGRRRVTVSLDGPGSSGKSSVGSAAAAAVGYRFCDTGVLYRGLAWLAHDRHVAPDDTQALLGLIDRMRLAPDEAGRLSRVLVDGRDVTGRLHSRSVDRLVSEVAADAEVRAALLPLQREIARGGGILMAGRDIGSVVLPDAELRLYLHVSAEERAARRARQRGVDPGSDEGKAILDDLLRRDGVDSGRATAPLRVPDGASVIRGDGLGFDATVALVVSHIRAAERRARARAGRGSAGGAP